MTADAPLPAPTGRFSPPSMGRVEYGLGSISRLPDILDWLDTGPLLLVTTRSLGRSELLARLSGLIGVRLAGTVTDVGQFAPSAAVRRVADEVGRLECTAMLSFGGGSVIDTVKAAAHALSAVTGQFIPHIAIPTTLSAAEFSPFYGSTNERTRTKTGGTDPALTPRAVVLDAEVCSATPDWLWYASGLRAIDHAVESILSPDAGPLTDTLCLRALGMLSQHLPLSSIDGDWARSRQHCQIGAWLSFFGSGSVRMGLSHALGRTIGPRYNIAHGHTSAILLPHVMDHQFINSAAQQARIAAALTRVDVPEAATAADIVRTLVSHLGLPSRLRDVGVPFEDLGGLAARDPSARTVLEAAW